MLVLGKCRKGVGVFVCSSSSKARKDTHKIMLSVPRFCSKGADALGETRSS